jgi:hypothetical protein
MAGVWTLYPRSVEGIEILDDGTIKLSALRAQATADGSLTYKVTMDPGNPNHILSITQKKIRLTVAVPLDHSIAAAYKLACDPTANIPTGPSGVADTQDIEPGVVRQRYTKAGETYKKYLRKDAYPTPATVLLPNGNPTPKAPDKLGGDGNEAQAIRDDTKYLRAQAYRRLGDVGRVQGKKSIYLKGVVTSWKPGDFIKDIGGARVNKVVEEVILHCGESGQKTELVLS